jgi:hypothetical protein
MGIFQQRHFEAIAKLIGDIPEGDLRVVTAIRFADLFAKDNDKFKHDKFMKACRVVNTLTDKVADRIDGYDRDDLGESPDY